MDAKIADSFFENVKWFNKFLIDLNTFYEKIKNKLEEKYQLTGGYYYYKPNTYPQIPSFYYLYLGGENKTGIQISTVLNKEVISNKLISIKEPSMVVLIHDYESYSNCGISEQILTESSALKDINKSDDTVFGILEWEKPIHFKLFVVPLDIFSTYSDELVDTEIVFKIQELVKQGFNK